MLEKGGCKDVKIDYAAKTATCTVPAAIKDEDIAKAVSGKFSAKVQN
jgi:hypothetical protein